MNSSSPDQLEPPPATRQHSDSAFVREWLRATAGMSTDDIVAEGGIVDGVLEALYAWHHTRDPDHAQQLGSCDAVQLQSLLLAHAWRRCACSLILDPSSTGNVASKGSDDRGIVACLGGQLATALRLTGESQATGLVLVDDSQPGPRRCVVAQRNGLVHVSALPPQRGAMAGVTGHTLRSMALDMAADLSTSAVWPHVLDVSTVIVVDDSALNAGVVPVASLLADAVRSARVARTSSTVVLAVDLDALLRVPSASVPRSKHVQHGYGVDDTIVHYHTQLHPYLAAMHAAAMVPRGGGFACIVLAYSCSDTVSALAQRGLGLCLPAPLPAHQRASAGVVMSTDGTSTYLRRQESQPSFAVAVVRAGRPFAHRAGHVINAVDFDLDWTSIAAKRTENVEEALAFGVVGQDYDWSLPTRLGLMQGPSSPYTSAFSLASGGILLRTNNVQHPLRNLAARSRAWVSTVQRGDILTLVLVSQAGGAGMAIALFRRAPDDVHRRLVCVLDWASPLRVSEARFAFALPTSCRFIRLHDAHITTDLVIPAPDMLPVVLPDASCCPDGKVLLHGSVIEPGTREGLQGTAVWKLQHSSEERVAMEGCMVPGIGNAHVYCWEWSVEDVDGWQGACGVLDCTADDVESACRRAGAMDVASNCDDFAATVMIDLAGHTVHRGGVDASAHPPQVADAPLIAYRPSDALKGGSIIMALDLDTTSATFGSLLLAYVTVDDSGTATMTWMGQVATGLTGLRYRPCWSFRTATRLSLQLLSLDEVTALRAHRGQVATLAAGVGPWKYSDVLYPSNAAEVRYHFDRPLRPAACCWAGDRNVVHVKENTWGTVVWDVAYTSTEERARMEEPVLRAGDDDDGMHYWEIDLETARSVDGLTVAVGVVGGDCPAFDPTKPLHCNEAAPESCVMLECGTGTIWQGGTMYSMPDGSAFAAPFTHVGLLLNLSSASSVNRTLSVVYVLRGASDSIERTQWVGVVARQLPMTTGFKPCWSLNSPTTRMTVGIAVRDITEVLSAVFPRPRVAIAGTSAAFHDAMLFPPPSTPSLPRCVLGQHAASVWPIDTYCSGNGEATVLANAPGGAVWSLVSDTPGPDSQQAPLSDTPAVAWESMVRGRGPNHVYCWQLSVLDVGEADPDPSQGEPDLVIGVIECPIDNCAAVSAAVAAANVVELKTDAAYSSCALFFRSANEVRYRGKSHVLPTPQRPSTSWHTCFMLDLDEGSATHGSLVLAYVKQPVTSPADVKLVGCIAEGLTGNMYRPFWHAHSKGTRLSIAMRSVAWLLQWWQSATVVADLLCQPTPEERSLGYMLAVSARSPHAWCGGRETLQLSAGTGTTVWRVVNHTAWTGADAVDARVACMVPGDDERHVYYWETQVLPAGETKAPDISIGVLDLSAADDVEQASADVAEQSVHNNDTYASSVALYLKENKVYRGTTARVVGLARGNNAEGELRGWCVGLLLDLNRGSAAYGTLSVVYVKRDDDGGVEDNSKLGILATGLRGSHYRPVWSIRGEGLELKMSWRKHVDLAVVLGKPSKPASALVYGNCVQVDASDKPAESTLVSAVCGTHSWSADGCTLVHHGNDHDTSTGMLLRANGEGTEDEGGCFARGPGVAHVYCWETKLTSTAGSVVIGVLDCTNPGTSTDKDAFADADVASQAASGTKVFGNEAFQSSAVLDLSTGEAFRGATAFYLRQDIPSLDTHRAVLVLDLDERSPSFGSLVVAFVTGVGAQVECESVALVTSGLHAQRYRPCWCLGGDGTSVRFAMMPVAKLLDKLPRTTAVQQLVYKCNAAEAEMQRHFALAARPPTTTLTGCTTLQRAGGAGTIVWRLVDMSASAAPAPSSHCGSSTAGEEEHKGSEVREVAASPMANSDTIRTTCMVPGDDERHVYYWETQVLPAGETKAPDISIGVLDLSAADDVEQASADVAEQSVHNNDTYASSVALYLKENKVYRGTTARVVGLARGNNAEGELRGWCVGLLLDLNRGSAAYGTLSVVYVKRDSNDAVTEITAAFVLAFGLHGTRYRPFWCVTEPNTELAIRAQLKPGAVDPAHGRTPTLAELAFAKSQHTSHVALLPAALGPTSQYTGATGTVEQVREEPGAAVLRLYSSDADVEVGPGGCMVDGDGGRFVYCWEVWVEQLPADTNDRADSPHVAVGVLDCGDGTTTNVSKAWAAAIGTRVGGAGGNAGAGANIDGIVARGSSTMVSLRDNTVRTKHRAQHIPLQPPQPLAGQWRIGFVLDLNRKSTTYGTLAMLYLQRDGTSNAIQDGHVWVGVVNRGLGSTSGRAHVAFFPCATLYMPGTRVVHRFATASEVLSIQRAPVQTPGCWDSVVRTLTDEERSSGQYFVASHVSTSTWYDGGREARQLETAWSTIVWRLGGPSGADDGCMVAGTGQRYTWSVKIAALPTVRNRTMRHFALGLVDVSTMDDVEGRIGSTYIHGNTEVRKLRAATFEFSACTSWFGGMLETKEVELPDELCDTRITFDLDLDTGSSSCGDLRMSVTPAGGKTTTPIIIATGLAVGGRFCPVMSMKHPGTCLRIALEGMRGE